MTEAKKGFHVSLSSFQTLQPISNLFLVVDFFDMLIFRWAAAEYVKYNGLSNLLKTNKRAMAVEASEQNMRASEAGEAISNHK